MTRTALTSVMLGALIGTSAFVTAASAAPAENLSVSLELYGGATFYANEEGNAPNDPGSAGLIGGAATINMPFSGGWFGQLDMAAAGAFNDGEDDDLFGSSVVGALHIGCRERDGNMFGIFGGGGVAVPDTDTSEQLWFVGVEGQLALREFVLYGQGGWFDSFEADTSHDSDSFHDAWFLRGVGRYSFSPDTFLQAELNYADGQQDTDDQDMTVLGWGARIEHRLDSVPNLSIFAAYDGARYENGDSGNDDGHYVEHIVRIGINVHFGSDGMTAIDTPNFGRWAPSGEVID
jgi:hypothetical protein